jgi:CheY-like chemotaxis protein
VTDLNMPVMDGLTLIRGADMQSLNGEAQRRDLSIRAHLLAFFHCGKPLEMYDE